MALEPITRQEKIIAGQDLTPITRMEKFLKNFGGGSGGGGGVQVVTITAVPGSSGIDTFTSSHTGSEINAMARKGAVSANLKAPDWGEIPLAYFGASQIIGEGFSLSFGASFSGGYVDKSMGTARYGVMYFYVDPETKEASFKQILF